MIIDYIIHVLILIGIYSILSISLNFAIGNCGLLNLGHIAFFGIGAYTSVLLTTNNVPFLAALVLSGLIASAFGLLLAQATKRIRGDYLALVTLGFNFAVYALALNLVSITNGPRGIAGIIKPELFGVSLANGAYLVFVLFILLLTYLTIKKIVNSSFGRLMGATRDNEKLLENLGKRAFEIKTKVLVLSSFFAGISGSLYVHYIGFIDPSAFAIKEIILILAIIILGGLASLRGTIIATIILISLPNVLMLLDLPSSILGPLKEILYALVLLAILYFKPRGLFGKIDLS